MDLIALLGRIFFSIAFIVGSLGHFTGDEVGYAASHGVPFPALLVPLSGLLALFGGLSILLGFKARWGAWLIVLFLVPVTWMMHNFWSNPHPAEAMIEEFMFLKNLSMLGGALLIAYFGSGPWSIKE